MDVETGAGLLSLSDQEFLQQLESSLSRFGELRADLANEMPAGMLKKSSSEQLRLWFFVVRERYHDLICLKLRQSGSMHKSKIELFVVICDIFAAAALAVPVATISALIVRIGVERLCD